MMATPPPLTPDELLAAYPPRMQKLVNRVRMVLHAAVPTFTERALPGWRAIAFRDPHAGHVCALFPMEAELRLYIEHGARLVDRDAMLRGTMKRGRYIAFRSMKDVRVRALTRLIREAVALQSM
jgi:hypothetical protein